MPSRPKVRYSYGDYLAIPEDPARRHEIVDGELHVSAAPRVAHQRAVLSVLRVLEDALGEVGEVLPGPVTVRLADDLVLEPDVVFVGSERMDTVDPEGGIHGPPDLVVEVLSPGNRAYDRDLKRKRYLENGVPEVWIVDVEGGSLEIWEPGASDPIRPSEEVRRELGGIPIAFTLQRVLG